MSLITQEPFSSMFILRHTCYFYIYVYPTKNHKNIFHVTCVHVSQKFPTLTQVSKCHKIKHNSIIKINILVKYILIMDAYITTIIISTQSYNELNKFPKYGMLQTQMIILASYISHPDPDNHYHKLGVFSLGYTGPTCSSSSSNTTASSSSFSPSNTCM
jgi:hypothetical protein